MKLKDFASVIKDTTTVLEINSVKDKDKVKALFRRAEAKANDLDSGMTDLKDALQISPEDKDIKNLLAKYTHLLQEKKKKEKAAYAKMFA